MAGISYEMLEQPNTYEPGDVYFGDWEIVREIGAGAYGRVYLLEKTDYGITFDSALKVIRIPADAYEAQRLASEGMSEEGISQYYEKQLNSAVMEISAMRSLQHPNVVRCDDFRVFRLRDEQRWDVLIRMELLTPLPRFLKNLGRDFTAREVARIGLELAGALAACAKEGLLHRDVKPENIFVEPHKYDEGYTCKLGDFGAARLAEANGSTMSRQGTELYMAPEVFAGRIYDARADIYSLGMVLYQLANGNHPAFYPRTGTLLPEDRERARMRRLRGEALERPLNADEALAAIICKACAHQAEARYAAADELCAALRDYLAGGTTVRPPEKPALPEGVRCTLYLDVNNEKGYVRGVAQESGTTVSAAELTAEEYYSPALVVWNQGDEPAVVTVAFTLDGETAAWGETTVKAKGNVAFRTNAKRLRGQTGAHRISWRCNDVEMGEFTWTVEAGEPRVPSLPEGVRCTMHLDVNNEKGYVRGVTQESGTTVSAAELTAEEYYSPALVVWNQGDEPAVVTVAFTLDGETAAWGETTVKAKGNVAFRTNAKRLRGQTGAHRISWRCNDVEMGEFTWTVEAGEPRVPSLPEGVRCTMHLDVNNEKGYVRGVAQESGTTISAADLAEDEYYSPALVVWNESKAAVQISVGYDLDGSPATWYVMTIQPGRNGVYRANASQLRGQVGLHTINWTIDGADLGDFTWTVEAGQPKAPALPEGVRCTMHLDVNNEKGYVRGVTQESGISVSASALDDGEFYSPALVVWNDGRTPVSLTPRGSVDGQAVGWQECSVKPGSNLAFRANASWIEGQLGEHTAEWYLDGIPLGEFAWEVFIPSPGRERMNEGTDEPVPGGPAEEDYSFDDSDDSFETPEEDFICKAVNASSVWIMEYTGRDRRVIIPYEMKGKQVTGICPSAFRSCTTLETVAFAGKIDRIDSCAFEGCKSLRRVELPRSVKEIGEWAFSGCVALESIRLPDSITRIGDCAFRNCESLQTVVLPDSVTQIGDYAFQHCRDLRAVTMMDSVVQIGDSAFSDCPSLRSVVIPDSVGKVGNAAFPNGQAVTLQIYRGDNPLRRASLLNRDESLIEAYARKHGIRCEKVRRPRRRP